MPKKLIKRYLPNAEKIKQTKGIQWMGAWLHDPNIWHLHRHSVAKAFLIGLFWMSIPMPSQMVAAAFTAIAIRANLALSVALVWISNPITMGPIFYFNYKVGTLILGHPAEEIPHFEISWQWISTTLGDLWMPLYLGSIVVGTILGAVSYVLIHLVWRLHVIDRWNKRKILRKKPK
ncbi:DUF2062 domain-containing protein [Thiomicrorhabdus indica]|uniref:DUF2062 domain-containing protein n=1 Tax=Thiomicrorhabdus indica TaxID=2267253 RepID=UPI00102D900C|nr:DUF2062 domain-containing protein [Thiomicrorhabdus indica]